MDFFHTNTFITVHAFSARLQTDSVVSATSPLESLGTADTPGGFFAIQFPPPLDSAKEEANRRPAAYTEAG